MTIVCSDGYYADFYKKDGKNVIDFFNDADENIGTMFDVNKNWGNWWYKHIQGESGGLIFDSMWLDFYAFYNDFDCYSDTHKTIFGFRPSFTNEDWKQRVKRARERKL